MREIKFRAWDKENKIMLEPDDFMLQSDGEVALYTKEIDIYMTSDRSENILLMQFTGLFDKNGKEIYEGDIVEIKNFGNDYDGKWKVLYQPIIAGFVLGSLKEKSIRIKDDVYTWDETEVIGNIYENPELLK